MRKVIMLFLMLVALTVKAQNFGIRTNLVPYADLTPNIGVEFALDRLNTLGANGGIRPWKREDDKVNKYWYGNVEYRHYFCHAFNGWYVGAQANGAQFNIGGKKLPFGALSFLENKRYEGWLVGGGILAGYSVILSQHWNLDINVGAGYEYIKYKAFETPLKCAEQIEDNDYHYIGPNDLSISFQYIF